MTHRPTRKASGLRARSKLDRTLGGDGGQQAVLVGHQDRQTHHVRVVWVSWTYRHNRQTMWCDGP